MSEEARRTLRYVEPLSDARTTLADFFSILLDRLANLKRRRLIEIEAWRCFDRNLSIPVQHPTAIGTGVEILRAFHFCNQLRRKLKTASGTDPLFDLSERVILPRRLDRVIAAEEPLLDVSRTGLLLRFEIGQLC